MTESLHHNETHREISSKPSGTPASTARILAALFIPVILVVVLQRISIEQPLKPGDQVPDLTLKTRPRGAVSLLNPDRQILTILFFSRDCSRCREELKNIEQLQRIFSEKVQFLLITRGDSARASALLDSLGIGVPVAFDGEGSVHKAFGVFKVPALFLINAQGIIQLSSFSEQAFTVRKNQLESLLNTIAIE